jgi:cell division protein ZapE
MGIRAAYGDMLRLGGLSPDPGQAAAVAELERLQGELAVNGRRLLSRPKPARGVYLWGPVGRGKSLLMDLFFTSTPMTAKQRTHFHLFMNRVHALVNLWRAGGAAARRAQFGRARGDDPIAPVAEVIAREASLLCFDELAVTDIADAMILGRLFEALFARGVTLVATSNRRPGDLYANGLNRQLFLPFIAMLEERLAVVAVDGARDWRLARLRAAGTWFSPNDPDHAARFDRLWTQMLGPDAEIGATIEVLGRRQHWPRAAGHLLRAQFASLCGLALGPADYLAIADRFETVFIEGLPALGPERRDESRRFATLIDALYEARRRTVVLATVEPDAVYRFGDQAFEFQRTRSRLEEMRSQSWIDQVD